MAGETGPVEAPSPPLAAYETPPLTPEQRRRLRRTSITFITICIALELAVGIGSLGDLRRLSTPGGVAKLWVQAGAARDCDALLDLMPGDGASDRAGKNGIEYCDAEAARYKGAVVASVTVLSADSGQAFVEVVQHGAAQAPPTVELYLRHVHGRWHVLQEQTGPF